MIASIHQPSYWPWLGLLDKIARSDVFVLLDDVQITKGSFQYRNKFFCNGEAKFITIPLNLNLGVKINEVRFRNDAWKVEHLSKYYNYYLKSPFFEEVFCDIEKIYKQDYQNPIDLLKESMLFSLMKLGINVKVLLSSDFSVLGTKGEMVLNLCKVTNCSEYLAGMGSYEYMQDILPKFKEANISVRWHSFKHPVYKQKTDGKFLEGLGCLDLFFFQGYEKSRSIFWENINCRN